MSVSARRKIFSMPTPAVDAVSDLIERESHAEAIGTLERIPMERIVFDPEQPRKLHVSRTDPAAIADDDPQAGVKREELEALAELADSIKAQGLIEPVGVYRHGHEYRLIWGERRVLASKLAGMETVLARLYPDRPRNVRAQQLVENVQRRDLSLAERLRGVRQLMDEAAKNGAPITTAPELGAAIGWRTTTAYAYWGVIHGPDDVLAAVESGAVNDLRQAYALACQTDADARAAAMAGKGEDAQVPAAPEAASKQPAEPATAAPVRRGRPATAIQLGKTRSPNVARYICQRLLDADDFAAFADANWEDMRTASDILRQVLKRIETSLENEQ